LVSAVVKVFDGQGDGHDRGQALGDRGDRKTDRGEEHIAGRLAVNQHPATIVAFQNWGPAVLLLPAAVWFWSSPDGADLAMFLLSGLLGTSGHLLLTYAFSRANASRLAPTEYTSLVWAAIIGFTMFGEVPTLYTFAGAALIVLGAFTLARR
jgi:S-adenosylmethionine uptake transporter